MILESGILNGRHQNKVYRIPCLFFFRRSRSACRSLSSRDSYHLLYFPGAHFCRTLSDLLSQSDVIVLCTPLTSETTKRVLLVFRSGPYELKEMNNLPYLIRFGHFLLQLVKFIAHKRRLPNVCQIKSCDCVMPSNGSFSGVVLYSQI